MTTNNNSRTKTKMPASEANKDSKDSKDPIGPYVTQGEYLRVPVNYASSEFNKDRKPTDASKETEGPYVDRGGESQRRPANH